MLTVVYYHTETENHDPVVILTHCQRFGGLVLNAAVWCVPLPSWITPYSTLYDLAFPAIYPHVLDTCDDYDLKVRLRLKTRMFEFPTNEQSITTGQLCTLVTQRSPSGYSPCVTPCEVYISLDDDESVPHSPVYRTDVL